jgi:hypothetical protein
MRRIGIIALGAMLIVAACSSGATDSDPGSAGTTAPDAATPETTAGAPDAEPTGADSADTDDPLDDFRDEGSSAVVIIGDERYEFEDLYCVSIGGAMGASSIGNVDPDVRIDLPPEDWETSAQEWEPPSVSLSIDDPYTQWIAGGDLVIQLPKYKPGTSQVDGFTTDGYHATGTATFVDIAIPTEELTPVTGSFEVTCPRP